MRACPCGCGRDIDEMPTALAAHDLELLELLPAVEHLASIADGWRGATRDDLLAFVETGWSYAAAIRVVAHGNSSFAARLSLPSALEALTWVELGRQMAEAVGLMDPEWARWHAPHPIWPTLESKPRPSG
jgi:hypothetical protein